MSFESGAGYEVKEELPSGNVSPSIFVNEVFADTKAKGISPREFILIGGQESEHSLPVITVPSPLLQYLGTLCAMREAGIDLKSVAGVSVGSLSTGALSSKKACD